MIQSAEEFVALRNSDNPKEYNRASHDPASIEVWNSIIACYPEMKKWVVHNKTIPIEILELLVHDNDATVRNNIARKRKLNKKLINILANDIDESVRYALVCNTKITIESLQLIDSSDSKWLEQKISEKINELTCIKKKI